MGHDIVGSKHAHLRVDCLVLRRALALDQVRAELLRMDRGFLACNGLALEGRFRVITGRTPPMGMRRSERGMCGLYRAEAARLLLRTPLLLAGRLALRHAKKGWWIVSVQEVVRLSPLVIRLSPLVLGLYRRGSC